MKKEPQIGVRVGLSACFALELEDVYRHAGGAHRALAFPNFCGLLIGLGLKEYRQTYSIAPNAPGRAEPDSELLHATFRPAPCLLKNCILC